MDNNILITAHHEAGHALMAYIVGWSINSIELYIQNGVLEYGVTNYDFGIDKMDNSININRRIHCLLGGPVSQAIYEKNNQIDIDNLGKDGVHIDELLSSLDNRHKEITIKEAIDTTATLLNINSVIKAKEIIV